MFWKSNHILYDKDFFKIKIKLKVSPRDRINAFFFKLLYTKSNITEEPVLQTVKSFKK